MWDEIVSLTSLFVKSSWLGTCCFLIISSWVYADLTHLNLTSYFSCFIDHCDSNFRLFNHLFFLANVIYHRLIFFTNIWSLRLLDLIYWNLQNFIRWHNFLITNDFLFKKILWKITQHRPALKISCQSLQLKFSISFEIRWPFQSSHFTILFFLFFFFLLSL